MRLQIPAGRTRIYPDSFGGSAEAGKRCWAKSKRQNSSPLHLCTGTNMDMSLLQWPAMVVNVLAVWLLASQSKHKRHVGFILLSLVSNALWIAWGMARSGVCRACPSDCAGIA